LCFKIKASIIIILGINTTSGELNVKGHESDKKAVIPVKFAVSFTYAYTINLALYAF
jgi:hypothetical protein